MKASTYLSRCDISDASKHSDSHNKPSLSSQAFCLTGAVVNSPRSTRRSPFHRNNVHARTPYTVCIRKTASQSPHPCNLHSYTLSIIPAKTLHLLSYIPTYIPSYLPTSTNDTMPEPTADTIAQAVLDTFDSLPAKRKPRDRGADGLQEWVPLAGIVLYRGE